MNRISRVALILCACFVSVAWGQQPAGICSNNWPGVPQGQHGTLELHVKRC